MAAGLCGVTLYFLLENIALTYTFASNVSLILSGGAFFTALAAHCFFPGERLTSRFFLGFLAAMAGVILITFNGAAVLRLNPLGDLLAVLAAVVWAFLFCLYQKDRRHGIPRGADNAAHLFLRFDLYDPHPVFLRRLMGFVFTETA